jgi:hypothetical protein
MLNVVAENIPEKKIPQQIRKQLTNLYGMVTEWLYMLTKW